MVVALSDSDYKGFKVLGFTKTLLLVISIFTIMAMKNAYDKSGGEVTMMEHARELAIFLGVLLLTQVVSIILQTVFIVISHKRNDSFFMVNFQADMPLFMSVSPSAYSGFITQIISFIISVSLATWLLFWSYSSFMDAWVVVSLGATVGIQTVLKAWIVPPGRI